MTIVIVIVIVIVMMVAVVVPCWWWSKYGKMCHFSAFSFLHQVGIHSRQNLSKFRPILRIRLDDNKLKPIRAPVGSQVNSRSY